MLPHLIGLMMVWNCLHMSPSFDIWMDAKQSPVFKELGKRKLDKLTRSILFAILRWIICHYSQLLGLIVFDWCILWPSLDVKIVFHLVELIQRFVYIKVISLNEMWIHILIGKSKKKKKNLSVIFLDSVLNMDTKIFTYKWTKLNFLFFFFFSSPHFFTEYRYIQCWILFWYIYILKAIGGAQ